MTRKSWKDKEVEELLTLRRRGLNTIQIAEVMGLKETRVRNKLCSIEDLRHHP